MTIYGNFINFMVKISEVKMRPVNKEASPIFFVLLYRLAELATKASA